MVNKSTLTYVSIAVLLSSTTAWAECNVKSNVKTETSLEQIDFDRNIKFDFITDNGQTVACQATANVNYEGKTITAKEQVQLRADVDMLKSCEVARSNAIRSVATQIGKVKVEATSQVTCNPFSLASLIISISSLLEI